MSGAHRRGAVVDERVLEITLELLVRHGYEFSVDQVAAAAEVHKTTIYRRWDTKPQLVAAAMERLAAQSVTVPRTGDPLADLADLVLQVAAALRQPAGVNALRAALGTAGADASLGEVAGRFLRSRYLLAAPLISDAQTAGLLRADVDPVLMWQAVVNPLHLNAVTGGPVDDATARGLLDLVLTGARA
ncbi:MAG TPA: TetR-like C-terminal domain-containing protein [Nocardioides sp.]|nr:TetR-like C-terminal domain-containing protein [Nocardioides sp.]